VQSGGAKRVHSAAKAGLKKVVNTIKTAEMILAFLRAFIFGNRTGWMPARRVGLIGKVVEWGKDTNQRGYTNSSGNLLEVS